MAKLIPSLISCLTRMNTGEKRFARALESKLEDDYDCWFDTPVGLRQRYTDFIILHARRGLMLVEVKHWKLETLHAADKNTFTLIVNSKLKKVPNPLAQVRQCCYQLINQLESDPALVTPDGEHQGKIACPYGFGVALTNITREQFNSHKLYEVLPEHQTICKDELDSSSDPEAFQKRLWDLLPPYRFPLPLTQPQLDRIRWHLFPEIRINAPKQLALGSSEEPCESLFPDDLKVMDAQQERLAKNLGDGHRIIHGVAGSGKTLILGYRARVLAKEYQKPVLVLCFNVTLAAKLRESSKDIQDKVNILHFHDWCSEQLRIYHVKAPEAGLNYFDKLVAAVVKGVEQGAIPRAQYSAVMIDEGHDFHADWLKLIVGMIDPATDSLLFLYDDAQSLYNRDETFDFALSSVGIKARGRTTVLNVNYRNTDQVLSLAYKLASQYLTQSVRDDEEIVEPKTAGRNGPEPVARKFESYEQEAEFIARNIARIGNQGTAWDDICITYRSKWMGAVLHSTLQSMNVPVHWLKNKAQKTQLAGNDGKVKLMTMHSSKGLEFPLVVVSGIGDMPVKRADKSLEAKLLYVAMTRSTEKLLVTSHRDSEFYQALVA